MKNILILEGRRTIGGGQVMTRQICFALQNSYNITVFLPDGHTDISDYLSDYDQYEYPMSEYNRGVKSISDIFRFTKNFVTCFQSLKKCVVDNKISILYVQTSSLLPMAVAISKLFNIDVICHLHVFHIDKKVRAILNLFLHHSNVKRIIGVSNYTLFQLSDRNKNKSITVYNCVDMQKKEKNTNFSDSVTISIVGDVIEAKGQHILIKAINEIERPININVVGSVIDDIYLNEIRTLSRKQVLNILGPISDISEYLDKTDIVVIPSLLSETFSLAMVEAWAKGIPTIASDIGGMQELVENFLPQHKNSMLFEVGNCEQLKEKILNIISNDNLYLTISNDVISVFEEKFTKHIFHSNILRILSQIEKE